MGAERNWRLLGLAALALVLTLVAGVSLARFLRGEPKPFEQGPAPPEVRQAIESTMGELLALREDERAPRVRQLASPRATPQALAALAALLDSMSQAGEWELAHADAYGPELVKAIYKRRGSETTQNAILFERRDGSVLLLDVPR
jgi:hypothetical protein